MVTIILDFSGIFCKDWKLSSKVTKWDRKSPRHFLSCFFQFNLCYKTTNCMFTNMFYFFIHKLAIGILGLCMAFLIPHLYKVLLSPVKKFFSITFYWEVSILFHIAVTCKRIKNGKYSQRSRPGQTSIDKYHRFPGHDDMMRDCFIRSVFTALTLPEISFLIPVFQLVLVYRLLPFCLFMWPRTSW